jgi:surface antigen
MRLPCLLFVGLGLIATAAPAHAQINPFKGNRPGSTFSATDIDLFGDSVRRLNQKSGLQVGDEDKWSNPATGSYGSSSVKRIFTASNHPCHTLHHELYAEGRQPPSNYDITWCRISNGQWKIKS